MTDTGVPSLAAAQALLGVGPDADAEVVRSARRRLAKGLHPDVRGGDPEAMRRLNAATATVLEHLARPSGAHPPTEATAAPGSPGSRPSPASPPSGSSPAGGTTRTAHDVASFVIEALPVEAFEALLVVTSWLGEVVVDDPPYQLDVVLLDPLRCWCRLDLVPDAGASTVSLTIAALPDEALPDLDDVRDLWVAALNQDAVER